jgi:hypothetical protein
MQLTLDRKFTGAALRPTSFARRIRDARRIVDVTKTAPAHAISRA